MTDNSELADRFEAFWSSGPGREYTSNLTGPERSLQRALRVPWSALETFDSELAQDLLADPEEQRQYAQEGLRAAHFDKEGEGTSPAQAPGREEKLLSAPPSRVSIRFHSIPDARHYRVGKYRSRQLNKLIAVRGRVIHMSKVEPHIETGAWECGRCGSLIQVPQSGSDIREPAECKGCERSGAFDLLPDHSTIIDSQSVVIEPEDSALDDPPAETLILNHDLCDRIGPEDVITATGVYKPNPFETDGRQIKTYLKVWSLDSDDSVETDAYSETELRDLVLRHFERLFEGTDDWNIEREKLVAAVVDEGVRAEEVEDAIENLIDDKEIANSGEPGRLMRVR